MSNDGGEIDLTKVKGLMRGNTQNTPNEYNLNKKLLVLGGFLVLGSAVTIAALFLPQHMPTVINCCI